MNVFSFLITISLPLLLSCSESLSPDKIDFPLLSHTPFSLNKDIFDKNIQINNIGSSYRLYIGEGHNIRSHIIFGWDHNFSTDLCSSDSLIIDSISLDFKVNDSNSNIENIISSFEAYDFSSNDISWNEDSLNYDDLYFEIESFSSDLAEKYEIITIPESESWARMTYQKYTISDSIKIINSNLCELNPKQILLKPLQSSSLIEIFSSNNYDISNQPSIIIHCKRYYEGEWTYTSWEVIGKIKDTSIYDQALIAQSDWDINYGAGSSLLIDFSNINSSLKNINQAFVIKSQLNLNVNQTSTNIYNQDGAILLFYSYQKNKLNQFITSYTITKQDSVISIELDDYLQGVVNENSYSDSILIKSSSSGYNFDSIVINPNGNFNNLEIIYIDDK